MSIAADFGPAFPLGEFSDDGAEAGWGVSVSAALRLTRLFGLYGSWERTTFDVKDGAGDDADSWTDSGIGIGIRLWIPRDEEARLHPWMQLGVGQHDLDRPIAGAELATLDTDAVRTIEGSAGLDVALVRRVLFVRPTLRYRRYSFDVESTAMSSSSRISYLAFGLGVGVLIGPAPNAVNSRAP